MLTEYDSQAGRFPARFTERREQGLGWVRIGLSQQTLQHKGQEMGSTREQPLTSALPPPPPNTHTHSLSLSQKSLTIGDAWTAGTHSRYRSRKFTRALLGHAQCPQWLTEPQLVSSLFSFLSSCNPSQTGLRSALVPFTLSKYACFKPSSIKHITNTSTVCMIVLWLSRQETRQITPFEYVLSSKSHNECNLVHVPQYSKPKLREELTPTPHPPPQNV